MTEGSTTNASRLLRRLARGLEKREALHSGAAREGLDGHLVDLVDRLRTQVQQTLAEDARGTPPRSVGLSLAHATLAQPHLDITFGRPRWESTQDILHPHFPRPSHPLLVDPDLLQGILGLEGWELDELRDEVDRRASFVLKQERAVDWLWHHFELPRSDPERLFRVLFPAAPREIPGKVGVIRYGAQLYATVEQNPPPPPEALYLGWLTFDHERTFSPRGTFSGRYVDEGLRRALARAIGATDAEVIDLLDRMVTVIPRKDCTRYLAHDQWRITGVAALTSLGGDYAAGARLAEPLPPGALYLRDFLVVDDAGELSVRDPEIAFDRAATQRTSTMLSQLYAEMLARVVHEDPARPPATTSRDLSLYDLSRHLRSVLEPLLVWARAPETVRHVQKVFGVGEEQAEQTLRTVAEVWEARGARRWWGLPTRDNPRTVQGSLLLHVLSSHGNLRHAFRRGGAEGRKHRDLLVLFAASYYAESSAGRLLRDRTGDALRLDPVARWFWGVWRRLSADLPADAEETWSGPNPILQQEPT